MDNTKLQHLDAEYKAAGKRCKKALRNYNRYLRFFGFTHRKTVAMRNTYYAASNETHATWRLLMDEYNARSEVFAAMHAASMERYHAMRAEGTAS